MPAQTITVTPSKAQNGQIEWTLCHKAPGKAEVCGGANGYPDVVLGKGSGQHDFTVKINDPNNLGISFSADPLWIQPNTKPTKHVIDANQITGVAPGAKQLVFKDKNKGKPVDLIYQLNFIGPDQKPVSSIDPAIKNGGTTIFGAMETAALLVGGAVLLALAVFWFRAAAAKRTAAAR